MEITYNENIFSYPCNLDFIRLDTSNNLCIGASTDAGIQKFNGSISTIRIYDRILTVQEISLIYNTEKEDFE